MTPDSSITPKKLPYFKPYPAQQYGEVSERKNQAKEMTEVLKNCFFSV